MEIRRYQSRDAPAVRRLNEEVLRDAGTDPADIPHPDDIEDIQGAYLDTGGEFLVAEDAGSDATESSEIASSAERSSADHSSGRSPREDGGTASTEQDAEVVGMGGLRVDGTEGELFRMRVAIDRQGEGIGTALLEALETAARERGVEQLSAWTAKRQSAAVGFYPNHGYKQVETATRDPDYTLIHFRKEL
jgi:ribosomal protein S18 acetylase RimI-like enzyme